MEILIYTIYEKKVSFEEMINEKKIEHYSKFTRNAYVSTRLLDTPFWGIFNLLPFILYKDLHATPFQLAILVTLKPLVSILSSYLAHFIYRSSWNLSSSIMLARSIAFVPFLLFPFISNVWYMILCFGLFMFVQVGMMPAWMELLHKDVPEKKREKVFSYTQSFGYLGAGLLPFCLGHILDEWKEAWRWTFFVTALLGLCSLFWQRLIPLNPSHKPQVDSTHPLLQPWKSCWNLLRENRDFVKFQIGFMLIGSGLMIIQPALPVFFVDHLHLSYTAMGVAITLCKGIGFAMGSPVWVRFIKGVDLFYFGSVIAVLAIFFPFLLLAAKIHPISAYVAYLLYGFMQSGNELSWNLSGPLFAKQADSSPYSNVNIIASGIRGAFLPFLGAFCLASFGSTSVIVMSGLFFLIAAATMASYSWKLRAIPQIK